MLNQIKFVKHINLPDAPDNAEFDVFRRVIIIGAIPSVGHFLQAQHDEKVSIAGSMLVLYPDEDEEVIDRAVFHDGSKLRQISSCVFANEKQALCGSPFSHGVLFCDV